MNWNRIFPATLALLAVVFGSFATAFALQSLESSEDVDGICRFSDSRSNVQGDEAGSVGAGADPQYQATRRKMAQEVLEVTIPAEHLTLIGYDHITGLLSVSGFRDYPLFSGKHYLRFREGCAMHFELSEEQARTWTARVRMGGAWLKVGFLLNAHDNYERPFCQNETVEADSAEGGVAGVETSRQILLSDLLYARLVDTEEKVISTYHTELGHRLLLRRASQAAGGQSAGRVPRVEVTSLAWTGGVTEAVAESKSEEGAEDSAASLDAWWRSAIEAAAYPCYQRGLARNGHLQGAFVMRMSTSEVGQAMAEVLLDTLQIDDVSSCIVERVRAIRKPPADLRGWSSVKVTLLFSLR